MEMRYAVYCMTRNIYRMIIPSLKSLLANNRIDKVFLLTEDDDVGFWLPENVEVINVSDQIYFKKESPNYFNCFTWMVMMRMALPFVLPNVGKVLSLDLDTIVARNLDELWDIPMDGKYVAGCIEDGLTRNKGYSYINCGVMLMNLEQMRDGMAERIIKLLNEKKYLYNEQDCMNEEVPEKGKLILDPSYNYGFFNRNSMVIPKIIHYAGYTSEVFKSQDIVCEWAEKEWEDILNG